MEIVKTLLKLVILAVIYLGGVPVLGHYLRGRDRARRVVLGCMAWWLVRPPSDFTLMLDSIEKYRGHTKGFEFNYMEAVAMGLALAALLEKRRDFRWLPPGMWAWMLWVGACLLSVPGAVNVEYALMPAFKFAKMTFVYLGVFAALHDEEDLGAVLKGFAVALLVQLVVCLWRRYVQGMFQVKGWFEHQNPMAMWSYSVALPMLALGVSRFTDGRRAAFYLAAVGGAGLVIVLSVSRASLAAFGAGSVLVMLGAFLDGVTLRRVGLVVGGVVVATLVMLKAANTFKARIGSDNNPKNDLRYALNLMSKEMHADRPWTGIGWNNYGLVNSRPLGTKYSQILERWEQNRGHRTPPELFMANPLSESLYWLLIAENGMLGFLGFLLFEAVTLWFGLRVTIHYWRRPLGLPLYAITTSLAILYFHGQVERVLTQTKNLTSWILFCAILARAEWWRRQEKKALRAKV